MKLINCIVEKENEFLTKLAKCKKSRYKTFIYGNGLGADNLERRIKFLRGGLVDKKYYHYEKNVFCFEDYIKNVKVKLI